MITPKHELDINEPLKLPASLKKPQPTKIDRKVRKVAMRKPKDVLPPDKPQLGF